MMAAALLCDFGGGVVGQLCKFCRVPAAGQSPPLARLQQVYALTATKCMRLHGDVCCCYVSLFLAAPVAEIRVLTEQRAETNCCLGCLMRAGIHECWCTSCLEASLNNTRDGTRTRTTAYIYIDPRMCRAREATAWRVQGRPCMPWRVSSSSWLVAGVATGTR